ncbi:hypothetical protein [Segniliparus rugosus]|uniref:Uncharacterized protein n=1 Tax=Segniliparus rugosus (strain ATCC BAA-974 / DSM 45345 / CCUG 50838 / CIP 108380 / JCM 13579 / CDC 945) TaxID=679197 RepID=U1LMS6_SEGRC|nr:hypothetical protein [Segniliparus rugosus]ERG69251.1 hypothetical protein HMPREF9336_04142 [Segniliparus rugosus ATCC BAA-974]
MSLRPASDLVNDRRSWDLDEVEAVSVWLGVGERDLLPKETGGGEGRGSGRRGVPAG